MDQAVSYGAFIIAIVTAIITIYSAFLDRQALRQERDFRAKEHAQQSLDMSYRLILDLKKDYSRDPYLVRTRIEAASSLLGGEYSLGLQRLLDYFEGMSEMVLLGALDRVMAYNAFSGRLRRYWVAATPRIEEERMRHGSPDLWENTEKVYQIFLEMEAEKMGCPVGDAVPSSEAINRFLQNEAHLLTTRGTNELSLSMSLATQTVMDVGSASDGRSR